MEAAVLAQSNRQSRTGSNGQVIPTDMKTCAAIMNIFHLIPAATSKLVEPLTNAVLSGEKSLCIEVGPPLLHHAIVSDSTHLYYTVSLTPIGW